jgi:hypothetical protein
MQLFTTFIGVGVDFNSELIEEIVKVRGANYFAVHSVPEFKARMNEVLTPTPAHSSAHLRARLM